MGIWLQYNQSQWNLAPLFVRHRNHSRFKYGRMCENGFLYFERRNVFAAADDDVFLAIDDKEISIFIPCSHISGMEPSSAQRFVRSGRLAPVAFHYAVATRDDFADGLPIARHVVIVGVHHS